VAGFGINIAELMLLLLHVYLAVLGEEWNSSSPSRTAGILWAQVLTPLEVRVCVCLRVWFQVQGVLSKFWGILCARSLIAKRNSGAYVIWRWYLSGSGYLASNDVRRWCSVKF
jgi:hypothetical protein